MANDKDFRVKNGLLVATDTTDLNSQGQIINSGSLGSFINFVDINTEFPETKATIGGNIDLDFSAYSYKINDNNMLWHGEGYVDTNTVVGKNAGTTTDYTSSNLTLLGHGAEPSSPTATNEVTLGDSNVKSFRIPGVGMSVDSTGLLTVNDISISGDITIDSDLVVNTIQVNDSARVTGNFTVDSDALHVDATSGRVGIGTTTPATALDVTGELTADSATVTNLTVNGTIQTTGGLVSSTGNFSIRLDDDDNQNNRSFYVQNNDGTENYLRVNENGDVSFYEDTGTTAKFFWDASAERLGIGTTSPDEVLHVHNASQNSYVYMSGGDALGETYGGFVRGYGVAGEGGHLQLGVVDNNIKYVAIEVDQQGEQIRLSTAGSERVRITSSGNVGIGTSSPTVDLHVSSSSSTKAIFERTGAAGAYIGLKDSSGSFVYLGGNSGVFEVQTPGSSYSTKLAITSTGNVGIGTTSPATALDVNGTVTADGLSLGDHSGTGTDHKATFGASNDLQIYHDGSGSYIAETGDGPLYIKGSANVYIQGNSTGETLAQFAENGAVTLYHNANPKIATTSTGISVTGSVELNGWTVTESGGSLYFATGGTNKMKLDASGNLQVVGNVESNATIS